MSKIDQLIEAATALTDEQIDGVLAYTRSLAPSLAGQSAYASASPDALASIQRGLEQSAAGETEAAAVVFARLQAKIDAARS
jgi:hypothetical protein